MPSKQSRKRPSRAGSNSTARAKIATSKPRAVIFDIDGTLADSSHRRDIITDWVNATDEEIEQYASLYHLDTPIAPVVELARTLHTAGFAIVLLTSRDCTQYERTAEWMKDHGVPFDELYVRDSIEDRRPSPVYKLEMLNRIREKYTVEFAIDDERGVARMFRENGVMCFQCADYDLPGGASQ